MESDGRGLAILASAHKPGVDVWRIVWVAIWFYKSKSALCLVSALRANCVQLRLNAVSQRQA